MNKTLLLLALTTLTTLTAFTTGAQAQMFSEPALETLRDAGRAVELERIATQRLAQRSDDAQAVLAAAIAALQGNEAPRRQAAIGHAEKCLEQQPRAAACHYALGLVLGVQAMSEGMMKAMGSLGRIKGSFVEALEIAPNWFPARSALVEFYLAVPGIAGGSTSKAKELARNAPRPEQAKALEARVALQDEQHAQALALLADVKPAGDSALATDVRTWLAAAAFGLVNKGEPQKARPVFEKLQAERPEFATGPYGLARVLTDTGKPLEAIELLARAAKLKGADSLPLDYRLGLAQLAAGQRDAAKESLNRFVKANKGSKSNLDDARKRLSELGA